MPGPDSPNEDARHIASKLVTVDKFKNKIETKKPSESEASKEADDLEVTNPPETYDKGANALSKTRTID